MSDHPDIEKLPLETYSIPVRETIREIFRNPDNGAPDNISKAGCLALALRSNEVGGAARGYVVWNAWREHFPGKKTQIHAVDFCEADLRSFRINFSRFFFGNHAKFVSVNFGHEVSFFGARFGNGADFRHAKFGDHANFSAVQWGAGVDFSAAKFGNYAEFIAVQWFGAIAFCGTSWGVGAQFLGAHGRDWANFESAIFDGGDDEGDAVDFTGLKWASLFKYLEHDQSLLDAGKKFSESIGREPDEFGEIDFSGATFHGGVSFQDRCFVEKTQFANVTFGKAPLFHGCELHPNSSFEGVVFPQPTGKDDAVRAYRTLKLAFSKQQAISEEQRFFRLEMEEETLREKGLKRLLFQAYKTFSDYGFSITRPLKYGGLGVLVLTALYGLLSWLGQCGLSVQTCYFAPQWLEFSLLQTLPLPGLDKLSEAASKAFWPQGAWWRFGLSALVVLHKTLSLAALFLTGLALRNLFKLK
jgi:uncharacterized protein YjbI with pentapeptide repeats